VRNNELVVASLKLNCVTDDTVWYCRRAAQVRGKRTAAQRRADVVRSSFLNPFSQVVAVFFASAVFVTGSLLFS